MGLLDMCCPKKPKKSLDYVIKWVEDTDKTIKNMLNAAVLKKMTDIVYRVIPIDLFSVSDRIGNFVFQFPSHCQNDHLLLKIFYLLSISQIMHG